MNMLDLGNCVPIVAICFALGIGCKAWEKIPDKWIPFILAVSGGIIGIFAKNQITDFPASDYVTAIAVGVVSGLSAIGVHQAYKQAVKKE